MNSSLADDTRHENMRRCRKQTDDIVGNVTSRPCLNRRDFGAAERAAGLCGYCNENCIYNAVEILLIVGVIANILVIVRVARDRRLRDSTFVAIATLALADLLFLSLNLTISFETVIRVVLCTTGAVKGPVFQSIYSICWFSCNSHVAFLAILRYVMVSNPLHGHIIMSPKRVMMYSGLIWVIGIILMGTLSLLIYLDVFERRRSEEYVIYKWICVYLIPVVLTVVLHCVKVIRIKRDTQESATENTRKSIRRMSRIVAIVIIIAIVLPVPYLVFNIMQVIGKSAFPSKQFRIHIRGVSQILFLLNSFINPFLYSFLSKRFRDSMKDMFCCRGRQLSDESNETADTPVSIRKSDKKCSQGAISLDSINLGTSTESVFKSP